MLVTRVMFTVTSSGYGEAKNETSSRGTSISPLSRAAFQSEYRPATAVSAVGRAFVAL